MIQLRRTWYIALNNLRLFFRDRLAVGMFILFPFLFIIMFNLLLANTGSEDARIELHLATQETDGISLHLIQAMETTDESTLAPGEPVIIWDKDYNQARADVEAKKLNGFLAFPLILVKSDGGNNTNLEVVVQAEATSTRMALNGLAQESPRASGRMWRNKVGYGLINATGKGTCRNSRGRCTDLTNQNEGSDSQALITYQAENVGDVKAINVSSFVVPGYLVMFVFFAAATASVDIIKERQNHTLERLLASSVRKESLLGGIYLGAVFRGLVQIAIFSLDSRYSGFSCRSGHSAMGSDSDIAFNGIDGGGLLSNAGYPGKDRAQCQCCRRAGITATGPTGWLLVAFVYYTPVDAVSI